MELGELIDALGDRYRDKNYEQDWEHEESLLRAALEEFERQFGDIYSLESPLSLGGSGIAIVVGFRPLGGEEQVLKLPRPVRGLEKQLNATLAGETEKLRGLRHQNLVRVTFQGNLDVSDSPFYIMEKLEGVSDADVYLESECKHEDLTRALVRIVEDALAGVAYLHAHGIVHLDLKPANIFVDSGGRAVVADLGFAKRFTDPGVTGHIGGTDGYMHPAYAELMIQRSDMNKNLGGPIDRGELVPKFDLYSLGQTVLKLLNVAGARDPKNAMDYSRQYLRTMAFRMLDGHLPPRADLPYGLPSSVFDETRYEAIEEVQRDLDKLTGVSSAAESVPEISRYHAQRIQASSLASAAFTDRIRDVYQSREMRALSRIPQLGFVRFVYPTATHSRLEHSLGTMALAVRYIRALYYDPVSPVFRQLINERELEALILAALVHDIGHYPLAHDLEEVSTEVFGHEDRALHLLRAPNSEVARAISVVPKGASTRAWTATLDDVLAILSKDQSIRSQILRSVIDGPIDADKMDYLVRDSENLRLPYGKGIDVEKLIQSLTTIATTQSHGAQDQLWARIGINERGRIAAESLAFARYAMYGSVYWHHSHRAAKAMLAQLGYYAMASSEAQDVVRKAGHLKSLREDLYAFLDSDSASQGELQIEGSDSGDDPTDFLDEGSVRVIQWLNRKGARKGRLLADSLIARRLYKRGIVVSRVRQDALDWGKVDQLYGQVGRNWRQRMQVNREVQEFVLAELERNKSGTATSLTPTLFTEIQALSTKGPLVLVDYPPAKSGVSDRRGLEYVKEAASKSPEPYSARIIDLEQSPVWRSLQGDNQISAAKLRVFCHPDIHAAVNGAIVRDRFEKAINSAIGDALA